LVPFEAWRVFILFRGETHHTVDPNQIAQNVDAILALNASLNMYMYGGGTSFGFLNGANFGDVYQPTVNSYDYDSPLNESGDPTEK
jgi:beta-galactosidase